jgi:LytS/YehU family sensor histidine kinase
MFIGTEISHLIISWLFGKHFCFKDSIADYKFNAFVVVVVGSLLLLYKAQKINTQSLLKAKELDLAKVSQLKTQAELQTLQSKINPHFLYNALNSIASLIHEDPDKAEDMTLKLSKLFRYSINSMQESFTTVKEEIEILNTYLDIEKIRFGKRIDFKLDIAPGLDDMLLPRFLVQPLVENALKHGLKDATQDGLLTVSITGDEKTLVVTVADNGIPFPDELNIGYGLQSTYDKLELLYGEGYEIKISNVPEKSIKIIIPNKNER